MATPELLQFFRQFHQVDDDTLDMLVGAFKSRTAEKGSYLVVPGQVQKQAYFGREGVQMAYHDSGAKQHVIAFIYPPGICAIPGSFSFQESSKYYLKCLTKSEFLCISFEVLQELFDQSPQLERLFRKMTEAILAGFIDRHIELHALTIQERYLAFAERSPHLLQLVPHKYIASYLGIDPTNFSRLFNSVKI